MGVGRDWIKGHSIVIGLGVLGAFFGGLVGLRGDQGQVSSPSDPGVPSSSPASSVPVHVSGWVLNPGVVWVSEGSLTADAIAAAGGALPGADLDSLNLAQPVYEGDQVLVRAGQSDASGGDQTTGDGLVDINTADSAELQTLPGVGPVLAGNIIAYRESAGRFETLEDLLDVPGIGETRLASIRDLIKPP